MSDDNNDFIPDDALPPRISCTLCVVGFDLNRELTSNLLGVEPTNEDTSANQPIRHGPDAGKYCWEHEVGQFETNDVGEVLRVLLSKIDSKAFRSAPASYLSAIEVGVIVRIDERSDIRPFISFDPDLVETLATLGANLDVNIF